MRLMTRVLSFVAMAMVLTVFAPASNAGSEVLTIESKTRYSVKGDPNGGSEATIKATLRTPDGGGRFPALIIINSSAGPNDKIQQAFSRRLPGKGIATLELEVFSPRWLGALAGNQRAVYTGVMAEDALNALKVLRGHPKIDAARIGIMGHSRGSKVATALTPFKSFLEFAGFTGQTFAFHIGLGNACDLVPTDLATTGAPILLLTGEKDDIHYPQVCADFANDVVAKGGDFTNVFVPGASHSLTTDGQWVDGAHTGKKCRSPTGYTVNGELMRDGQVRPRRSIFRDCYSRTGYHGGYGTLNRLDWAEAKVLEWMKAKGFL